MNIQLFEKFFVRENENESLRFRLKETVEVRLVSQTNHTFVRLRANAKKRAIPPGCFHESVETLWVARQQFKTMGRGDDRRVVLTVPNVYQSGEVATVSIPEKRVRGRTKTRQ